MAGDRANCSNFNQPAFNYTYYKVQKMIVLIMTGWLICSVLAILITAKMEDQLDINDIGASFTFGPVYLFLLIMLAAERKIVIWRKK